MEHPTITLMQEIIAKGDDEAIATILAEKVAFLPPTYWKTWVGREPVSLILSHVGQIFTEFRYRRIMGEGNDWALEFQCKIGELDAVGVDLITLDEDGLISHFEVVMRPLKSVSVLREEIMARIMKDARFIPFASALQ
ncbi:MAG: nuclear transport factor 2 family protein [Pseudomonadota bacterium]